jgi:hypothetical protein
MAVLDAAARNALPTGAFAIPETRSYPIHDEAHAKDALSRVAANGTPEEKQRVTAAVKNKYPHMDVAGKSTTGENQDGTSRAGTEPSMREIFKPGQRVGKDNAAKPAPAQPMAKKRFQIGKDW